jgi:DUF971 family protein
MKFLSECVINEIEVLSRIKATEDSLSYDPIDNIMVYSGRDSIDKSNKIEQKITPKLLRSKCRCAVCVEEFTGKQLLDPETIPAGIKPLSMAPIGRYAISVDWSDGHKSLFPFRRIKELNIDN